MRAVSWLFQFQSIFTGYLVGDIYYPFVCQSDQIHFYAVDSIVSESTVKTTKELSKASLSNFFHFSINCTHYLLFQAWLGKFSNTTLQIDHF